MINQQRVRRIRGFLYICIMLVVIVPIILMIVVSFQTLGFLGELRTTLAELPALIADAVPAPDSSQVEEPSVADQSAADDIPAAEYLDNQDETPEQPQQTAGRTPEEDGRYVTNNYLPSSHPGLYFDTVPESVSPAENTLYLTFDNTPSSQAEELLAVLRENNVQATFFVWWNDSLDDANISFYKQLVAEGHQIGNRPQNSSDTYSEIYSSVDEFLDGFQTIFDTIQRETGQSPRLYRLPGGSVSPYNQSRQQLLREIKSELDARGFLQYDWSASAQDAVAPPLGKDQVLLNLERSIAQSGQVVILAHDGTGSASTAQALDEFIGKYKAAGYSFGVLSHDTQPVSFLN